MNKTINTPLPYDCSASSLTKEQISESERKNVESVKSIADDLESKILDGEYLPRKTFLDVNPHKIITVLVQNAYDSIQRANRYSTPIIAISIEKNENKFTLSVTDNGTGFNMNNQYSGCVPFGGHGSGLDEVKDLVEGVSGKLTTNNNTVGATVGIEIPLLGTFPIK